MSFYDILKNLFGITGNIKDGNTQTNTSEGQDYRSQFLNPDNEYSEDSERSGHDDRESNDMPQFNVYSDPIEMHRYFEEQINEALKVFSGVFGPEGRSFFGFTMPPIGPSNRPETESSSDANLREHLLKPGYHNTKNNNSADSDVDGKVNVSDLDILLKTRSSNDRSLFQPSEYVAPQVEIKYGQSMTSKTIRGPDGAIETHRSVRDSAGNEETTITRQLGDKQYTVRIRTDKHGVQEKVEDMKNIDEQELSRFTDNWKHMEPPQKDVDAEINSWFGNLFK